MAVVQEWEKEKERGEKERETSSLISG